MTMKLLLRSLKALSAKVVPRQLGAPLLVVLLAALATLAYADQTAFEPSLPVGGVTDGVQLDVREQTSPSLTSTAVRRLRSGGPGRKQEANFCADKDVSYAHRVDNPAGGSSGYALAFSALLYC